MQLSGVIPALITPMDQHGKIDTRALERQAAYLADSGVHGFLIGGTTAEGAYLSTDELRTIYTVVRGVSQGRQYLCLASLRASTAMVQEELQSLADLEPDYVVVTAPYYMSVPQEGIKQHFQAILKVSPAPLIVYNIPSTTHNPIALDTVLDLAGDRKVAGTKDSSGDFIAFSQGVLSHPDDTFSWIQGEDHLYCSSLFLGARGLVSGLCNVFVEEYVALYRASLEADWETLLAMQRRINHLCGVIQACGGRTIPAIKAAACVVGRCQPWMRNIWMSPTEADIQAVTEVLESREA